MGEQNNEKEWDKIDWKSRSTYNHFDGFLKTFVAGGTSYIRENYSDSFNKDKVDAAYKLFCEKSKDTKEKKDKKFDEVVNDFKDINLEILNHAIFLWGVA